MAEIRIGMSGWTHDGWRGDFYPKGVTQKKELSFASRQVNSIEINGTFYSLQKPHTFQKWHDEVPDDFIFAVKAPRYITHIRRLKDCEEPLNRFLESGLMNLKEKLGPILWQFPPNVMLKDDRFEEFLKILPFNNMRHAFEFRHPSFMNPDFIAMLREYGVAIVFAHSGEKSPYLEDITADFIYARMHGQEKKYSKGYTKEDLAWWADRVALWTAGKQPEDAHVILDKKPKTVKRDAFIYFDTEAKKYAPYDALNLARRLGIKEMMTGEKKKLKIVS